MNVLLWILGAFWLAAVPFSVLLGYVVARVDIRTLGDGNPGSTNVLRATGSRFWFIIAVNLDICKGLVPVALGYWYGGLTGYEAALVALAAITGHAFSPFLKFDGGKAVATTGGVWFALSYFETLPPMIFLLVYCFMMIASSDWTILIGMLGFGLYILLSPHRLDSAWWLLWMGNLLILVYKHRKGLREPLRLRPNRFYQPEAAA